ncbi:MAG: glycosyltransferase [Ignavibacteriaceae bacterium]|jgi:glycosyltransferase involved in cell wall biosynthesis
MLKILHIAPQNYAGVPYDFYQMHNASGDYSRLITFHKNPLNFPEDICLELPLPNISFAKRWRRKKMQMREADNPKQAPKFQPANLFERSYFIFNDFMKKNLIDETIDKYHLNEYDIIHFDSGLDFYRNAKQANKWKNMGKKIICCYYGSDLRIRGLIEELDIISDLNITSEYDHLSLKSDLEYLFYPYDTNELPARKKHESKSIKIVHSPTNRKYKGTELILSVIDKIKKEREIEFILLENMSRDKVLAIKSECDIAIDQVGGTMGGTGYGKAGIETLAMGIPTITNMTKEYETWLPENPFVVANNGDELYEKLSSLIFDENIRNDFGFRGKNWVEKYHSYKNVNKKLYELYNKYNIV